ncbi:hypothetical protein NL676_018316 [Syzygium grande]|nr:hypothetical protein NL676_018316 [Syzygium grande]
MFRSDVGGRREMYPTRPIAATWRAASADLISSTGHPGLRRRPYRGPGVDRSAILGALLSLDTGFINGEPWPKAN